MRRPDCDQCNSLGWLLRRELSGREGARPCDICNATAYETWRKGGYRSTLPSDTVTRPSTDEARTSVARIKDLLHNIGSAA